MARRRIAVTCKTTPSGAQVCRSSRPSKTKTAQRLVKAIRAVDRNADLQGITHNTRELRALLNFLVKDA